MGAHSLAVLMDVRLVTTPATVGISIPCTSELRVGEYANVNMLGCFGTESSQFVFLGSGRRSIICGFSHEKRKWV